MDEGLGRLTGSELGLDPILGRSLSGIENTEDVGLIYNADERDHQRDCQYTSISIGTDRAYT